MAVPFLRRRATLNREGREGCAKDAEKNEVWMFPGQFRFWNDTRISHDFRLCESGGRIEFQGWETSAYWEQIGLLALLEPRSRFIAGLDLVCWNQPTRPAWPTNWKKAGFFVQRQKPVPLIYEGVKLECGFRADIVVDDRIVVEIKCKEELHPVDQAKILSHLRLLHLQVGLLINFHVTLLKDGIKRMVNNYQELPESSAPPDEQKHCREGR